MASGKFKAVRIFFLEEKTLARINAQMTREEICSRADIVIRNVKGYVDVRRQIFEALRGRKF